MSESPYRTLNEAQLEAEIWKLKYELEVKNRECNDLKLQIQLQPRQSYHMFSPLDDLKLIDCVRDGLTNAQILKLTGWSFTSINNRKKKLIKDGRL